VKLPAFGRALLELRKSGQRPSDPVVVTDDWTIAEAARQALDWYALVCDPPEVRRDLSMLLGLDVQVVYFAPRERIAPMAAAVRAARPRRVTFVDALAWQDWLIGLLREVEREREAAFA
jgi:hypothetical protein